MSEGSTEVFAVPPNRPTFYFSELESLNFVDFYGSPSQPNEVFLPLQSSKLFNCKAFSVSKQFSVTKISSSRKLYARLFEDMKKTYLYGQYNRAARTIHFWIIKEIQRIIFLGNLAKVMLDVGLLYTSLTYSSHYVKTLALLVGIKVPEECIYIQQTL